MSRGKQGKPYLKTRTIILILLYRGMTIIPYRGMTEAARTGSTKTGLNKVIFYSDAMSSPPLHRLYMRVSCVRQTDRKKRVSCVRQTEGETDRKKKRVLCVRQTDRKKKSVSCVLQTDRKKRVPCVRQIEGETGRRVFHVYVRQKVTDRKRETW